MFRLFSVNYREAVLPAEAVGYVAYFCHVAFLPAYVFLPVLDRDGVPEYVVVYTFCVQVGSYDYLVLTAEELFSKLCANLMGGVRGNLAGGKALDKVIALYAALLMPLPFY